MSKKSEHYVNNAQFSEAVVKYVEQLNKAKDAGKPLPIIPDYVADCFMRIAQGLSHKSNFIRYTYREEMVMDGVENCLKAIENYDIKAATRTGKPNAFSYFTTIIWYAFLRRIAKEQRQQDIKMKYMSSSGFDAYATFSSVAGNSSNYITPTEMSSVVNYVDTLKGRIDQLHDWDTGIKEFEKAEKENESKKKVNESSEDSVEDD